MTLAGLEYDVAIRKDDGSAPTWESGEHVERARIEAMP